jgi:hypothetical protein
MSGYWGERFYLETVDQTVPQALGRAFSINPLPETTTHPGLFSSRYDDAFTDSMLVRPRLQNYAARGFRYSPYVESVAEPGPGG